MAFDIKVIENPHNINLANVLMGHMQGSRFKFTVSIHESSRYKGIIRLHTIRLKQSKPYCGAHPDACERGSAHRKGVWLEGADWVSFNDWINHILNFNHISANVATSVCTIRKGRFSRVRYTSEIRGLTWSKNGDPSDYADLMGKRVRSEYPEGTPGIYAILNEV